MAQQLTEQPDLSRWKGKHIYVKHPVYESPYCCWNCERLGIEPVGYDAWAEHLHILTLPTYRFFTGEQPK